MSAPAACSAVYVMLLERVHDRDALDDELFTSPDEQRRRRSEATRKIILESGGEIADVIPIRGAS